MRKLSIFVVCVASVFLLAACSSDRKAEQSGLPSLAGDSDPLEDSPTLTDIDAQVEQPRSATSLLAQIMEENVDPISSQTTESGLKIEILKAGSGAEAQSGQMVAVHYHGTLEDGRKFDSSLDRGQPFSFPLGGGRVIQGWDEGVAGMQVGEVRRLTIPATLGYGANGVPGSIIGPDATLIFEVELLAVQ